MRHSKLRLESTPPSSFDSTTYIYAIASWSNKRQEFCLARLRGRRMQALNFPLVNPVLLFSIANEMTAKHLIYLQQSANSSRFSKQPIDGAVCCNDTRPADCCLDKARLQLYTTLLKSCNYLKLQSHLSACREGCRGRTEYLETEVLSNLTAAWASKLTWQRLPGVWMNYSDQE